MRAGTDRKKEVMTKIEISPFAPDDEKLRDVAQYLEQLKKALVDVSSKYDEDSQETEEVYDLLGDALATMDDLIDVVIETSEAIGDLG